MENKQMIMIEENNILTDETKNILSCEKKSDKFLIKYKNSKTYLYPFNMVFRYNIQKTITLESGTVVTCQDTVYEPKKLLYLYDVDRGKRRILFFCNSSEILKDATIIHILDLQNVIYYSDGMVIRKSDGSILQNVSKIHCYDGFYKIYFTSGNYRFFPNKDIEISNLYASTGPFSYFKEIANALISPDDDITCFLSNQYEDLAIDNKSIFYNFLGNPHVVSRPFDGNLLFPFLFNGSQIRATKIALSNNISVIEGPPGTGKTQTILNILMNLIYQHKTVAVVSGNNTAVQNVRDKLEEYGLDFLTALLGNKSNRDAFFEQLHPLPDLSPFALSKTEKETLLSEIQDELSQIEELLECNNSLANLSFLLSQLDTEFTYFNDSLKTKHIKPLNFSHLNVEKLSDLIVKTYTMPTCLSIWNKLKLLLSYQFFYFKDWKVDPNNVQLNLKRYLYIQKNIELKAQRNEIREKLKDKNFYDLNTSIQSKSMKLLKAFLYDHYTTLSDASFSNQFGSKDYFLTHFSKFIERYPIILSTVHSLRNCSAAGFLYDYVIIDEASQTDLVAAGIALSCAKNVIVVGDLKQLPHIVPDSVEQKVKPLFESKKISPYYNYVKYNILSSVKGLYRHIPVTLLKEHYRCHPKIIGFCNQFFYNNALVIHSTDDKTYEPLMLIESAKGNHSRENENKKLSNLREVEECIRYYPSINKEHYPIKDIAFIAPFCAQVNLAEKHLDKNILKSTINKVQGQECSVVIFSTVLDGSSRANKRRVDFVNNLSLVNVAVSRAKKRFVLISNADAFKPGSMIAELTNYIKYNSLSDSIIKSDVFSIFDLMYRQFSDKLLDICVKNIEKVSDYPSENLANYVIDEVLRMPKYHFLKCIFSVNLCKLIKNPHLLTEEEKYFVYETSSEVDFVIYNQNSHMPILLIEVDGFAFHHKEKDQKRDLMKNRILNKYGIHYLRMPTNGSGEKQRLMDTLDRIIREQDEISFEDV